jgi:hypothetical protein
MPVIDTGPDEWRSSARPSSYTRAPTLTFPRLRGEGRKEGGGGKWTESNLLPKRTAFTAQRRHQPVLICTSRISFALRAGRTDLEQFMRLPVPDLAPPQLLRVCGGGKGGGSEAFHLRRVQPVHPWSAENWRKREVLIPNDARPSISLRTSAGLLSGYVSVFGGRLSARCSYASGVPFALQAMPIPRSVSLPRLNFQDWRSGEVSIPTRCRAANFQNPLPSRRRPLRIWRPLGESNSVPSASEADALFQ